MPFRAYLRALREIRATGDTTELSFRSALEELVGGLEGGVRAINEPGFTEGGAPDLVVRRGQARIGFIETKDLGADLEPVEDSEQLQRYRRAFDNLVLTNYLEFRWYVEGQARDAARLARMRGDRIEAVSGGIEDARALLQGFLSHSIPSVGTAQELAERMAGLTQMMKVSILDTMAEEGEGGSLHSQHKAFEETLIPGLSEDDFADMYAQTIAYGLFAARYRTAATGHTFSRESAAWELPATNPFLRRLFSDIAGPDLSPGVAWAVDDLVELLGEADMSSVVEDFGRASAREDPVVHFYETFLQKYDPRERRVRGVYYTPEPVVSYIVRSIDYLLKERFHRPMGLADPEVYILDPAVGTGTFLYFVIRHIHQTLREAGQLGAWQDYVHEHLLPRVFGFEIMMAPYTICHMKLGILLRELGYEFQEGERLGVYLTNTLEEAAHRSEQLFAEFISREANAAADIKREKPIMVVLGNPPYSVASQNQGDWIEGLMDTYKEAVRGERQIAPLSDDYIRFLRFAHDRIERTGHGIIGMITNHAWLSGLIHRGMRDELSETFGEIRVLDLHGNARIGERAPDGSKDDNVFDIEQGVAISLFVKERTTTGRQVAYYAELWGDREGKYQALAEGGVEGTRWTELRDTRPYHFFVPKDFAHQDEYERAQPVSRVFDTYVSGVQTKRDRFVIDLDEETLRKRIDEFSNPEIGDAEIRQRYHLRDTRDWSLREARQALSQKSDRERNVRTCMHRCFDFRHMYYDGDVVEYPRVPMRNLLRENVALVTTRRIRTERHQHFVVSQFVVNKVALSSRDDCFVFPLYLYPEDNTLADARRANLNSAVVGRIGRNLGLDFAEDGRGDLESTFGPEDVFDYMYGIFYCPTYRERYAEFLKIDFPRVPLTSDLDLFRDLVALGGELVDLHLMRSPGLDELITSFPVAGSNEVERVRYQEPTTGAGASVGQVPSPVRTDEGVCPTMGRVWINKEQYFEGIEPEVWEFQIGGYQVLNKWLKDRRKRTLSWDDIRHYQRVVVALSETMRIMEQIDERIESWPIE